MVPPGANRVEASGDACAITVERDVGRNSPRNPMIEVG